MAGGKDGPDKAESHDANAWEAAQHILQAINFSALHQIEDAEQPDAPFAEATSSLASGVGPPTGAGAEAAPRATLTEDERAALQAQLALLAAQLTEIANASDDEDEDDEDEEELLQEGVALAPQQPVDADVQMQHELANNPGAVESGGGTVAAPDGGQLPVDLSAEATGRAMAMLLDDLDSAAQAMAQAAEEEEESDEDEDMEMVEVPTYVESDALRT